MTKEEILSIAKKANRIEKDKFILDSCKGQSVLDVGFVGQDRDFDAPNWLHNKVRGVATQLIGVDIMEEPVRMLKAKGYSVFTVEELKGKNDKFKIVLMSDVIEHVNDPVSFLSFYSNFLETGGKVIVSTPNSNRANNFIHILFNNNYSVNPEHTFWFCPRTMAEVVDRAGLQISEFFWAGHYFPASSIKGIYQKFKLMLINLLISLRTNFSPNMIFVITRKA
jgi:2-polyprenyl-3-methyl-5-hydroxy-6-metoxy-1,4-benzoquinol methylase